jgi:hypothetical protein
VKDDGFDATATTLLPPLANRIVNEAGANGDASNSSWSL